MYKNEILDEIHKYRDEYAKSFEYDLRAIFNDLTCIIHEEKTKPKK